VGDKLAATTPYFSCMCKAMAKMLELNEESNDGWMTASIAGHSGVHELARITEAEGLMLEHYGLTHVGQLFGRDDITGRIKTGIDTDYPEDMTRDQAGLIIKCKNLRRTIQGRRATGDNVQGNFWQITEGVKYSGLFRKLTRETRDAMHPGPPSFFTKRRDGIPVPTLGLFMSGYRNLFKLDIPSKTLENSYLIMNRQIWTNQKNLLSREGEPGGKK
jgi:hypothetical protein